MSGIKRPTSPRDLVDLRTWMVDEFKPGRLLYRVQEEWMRKSRLDVSPDYEARTHRDFIRRSDLWWVTPDMCELIEAAMPTVPLDVVLTPELRQSQDAVCFLEKPFVSVTSTDEEPVVVDVIQWSSAWHADKGMGLLSIRCYTWHKSGSDSERAVIGDEAMIFIGETWWMLGDTLLDDGAATDKSPTAVQSRLEDRQLVTAIWLLASQPGLAESRTELPDRHTARRAKRAGIDNSDVRVVSIRKALHDGPTEHRQGSSPSVRFLVSGHWRNQPYGPGLVKRRPKWIAPYVKGPDDAPLRIRETVKVLR